MKNIEKYIYITIIIILVGIIAGGATYMVMKNNDKPEIKEENKPSDKEIENKPTEEEPKKEQISLTETELEKYISYIPNAYEKELGAYEKPNLTINDLDDKYLMLKAAYNYVTNNSTLNEQLNELDAPEIDESILKTKYKEMFNKEIDTSIIPDISSDDVWIINGARLYKEENKIYMIYCMEWDIDYINIIDSYEATTDELIIYEYAAEFYQDTGKNTYTLQNYLTEEVINYDIGMEYDVAMNEAKNYLNTNKPNTYKYRHTFKKGSNGYYWYKTQTMNITSETSNNN